ncbi:MAG: 2-amino-4-hydroxy-6-hydroxymethyldihydropteridine diphosphokinase [Myxococcales bacterium]|jgi:2-amino-4-hydroxy-6-hydroxymethyldihydropteridine diphosphokinase|nr:2-amino-4-hydroxy-6-hydroxymethyldihydropteridine diphosphokinase [Myxococcales bacterium]
MRVFLGLGTNLGDRAVNLERAIDAIAQLPKTHLEARASLYESAPIGPDQPEFLNTVVGIETRLPLLELLRHCKQIESTLGRVPTFRWGPRLIDIDLLIADEEHHSLTLDVPHAQLHLRRFALEPLCELIPEWRHPGFEKTLRALCELLPGQGCRKVEGRP